MALPNKNAKPKKKEFLQEVVEPEIQVPTEPEMLQEIFEGESEEEQTTENFNTGY
jgi:hypothetical protein